MKDWEPENKRKIRKKMKLEEEKNQKIRNDERRTGRGNNATKRMTNST